MLRFCIHQKVFALPYTCIAALHRCRSSSLDIPARLIEGRSNTSCSKNRAFLGRGENQDIGRKVEDSLTAQSDRLEIGENNFVSK